MAVSNGFLTKRKSEKEKVLNINKLLTQYEGDVRTPKEDLMKLFASTLGVPIELFTVPVLSEPREYEAASFWMHKLGAELE